MKFLFFSLILGLSGCSNLRITQAPATKKATETKSHPDKHKKAHPPVASTKGTAWELLSDEQISLQFKDVDNESNLTVILDKGISEKMIDSGHWELTGFEVAGISYLSMSTSKKFVMRTKANVHNYGGSIILGCPTVSADGNRPLKQLKFFDRYPFSSSKGLCELVVGDNLRNVRNSLRKSKKLKKLNLFMTF